MVFLRRDKGKIKYPKTKSEGPYIFLGYGDPKKRTALLINPKNSKIRKDIVTHISPIRVY